MIKKFLNNYDGLELAPRPKLSPIGRKKEYANTRVFYVCA